MLRRSHEVTTADDVLKYVKRLADGGHEDQLEDIKPNSFIKFYGQSFEWIFSGDPTVMIATAAIQGPAGREDRLANDPVKQATSALSELEHPLDQVRHLGDPWISVAAIRDELAVRLAGHDPSMP